MEDWRELQLGLDRLLETVQAHPVENALSKYKAFLLSGIRGYQEQTLDVFVASFSEAPDFLYHWCEYTPTGGVAIGLRQHENLVVV